MMEENIFGHAAEYSEHSQYWEALLGLTIERGEQDQSKKGGAEELHRFKFDLLTLWGLKGS